MKNFKASLILASSMACFAASSLTAMRASADENLLSTRLDPKSKTELKTKTQKIGVISAGWLMSLDGQSFANEKEQAKTAGLGVRGDIRYGLLSNLEVRAEAGFSLESGYAQSRFGDNTPKSGMDLREALIQFKPMNRITVQAGALNQSVVDMPLLVSSQPFPGVLEKAVLGTKDFNVELKAEQAVPTSTTLSTKAVDAETNPTFMTELMTANAKLTDRVSVSAEGLHYAFHNLPSTVAAESELYGNTVSEVTAKNPRFAYEFNGYGYGGGLKVLMSRTLSWTLDTQILQNTKAPASYGAGQIITSGFNIGLPGDVDLKPKGEYFYAESDVSPAYYNGSDRGHNNRTGWAADMEAVFKDAGFLIGGRFVQSHVINESLVQSQQSFFMLRFETLYDLL